MPDPAPPAETDALEADGRSDLEADRALPVLEGEAPLEGETPGAALEDGPARDAERLASEPPTACMNCGSVLPGRFCPDCGQKDQPLQQPAHVFIAESVSEYFGLDGRLWRSLGALLFQPGTLTLAYLEGRRTRYLRPLRLYLSATVFFFFLLSFLDTFQVERTTLTVEATPRDAPIRVGDLEDRLEDREEAAAASRDAVRSAAAPLRGFTLTGLSALADLEAEAVRQDSLRAALDAAGDALSDTVGTSPEALADLAGAGPDDDAFWGDDAGDSLVVPARLGWLGPDVLAALEDSGAVEVDRVDEVVGGVGDDLPDWMKGDLARRLEETESPAERALLVAQYQQAVLRQVPPTLFVVLPIFALLLKLFYLGGGGRAGRLRSRPLLSDAPSVLERSGHAVRVAGWGLRRGRGRWRRWRARRRHRKAAARRVRGAPRRWVRRLKAHERLRGWRARRVGRLRRALRANRPRYYSEHLVFALHVHAFTFVALIPAVLFGWHDLDRGSALDWLGVAVLASIPVYFLVAQRRVYREGWARTVSKSAVLSFVYLLVISGGAVAAATLALRLG